MTPSHLRILQELGVHNSSISRLIIGGEALTTSLAKSVQAQNKALKIFNEYGPTEATVGCSAHWYSEQDTRRDVPIGNACFNSEILLLNEELKHIKMGQLGEICISGHCLADGYLNASNENRFISHPFRKGAKLYLTGDLGIWDGRNLHYYGRRDEQVKIRGHRIELAEIEQALSGLPGIKTCAVVTSAVTDAHLKLVAYIVWQPNSSKINLREALSKKIPEYMIPLQFLDIELMPLNINGKVDKARLPIMSPIEFSPSQSTEDDIEKQLLAYAGELINISPANIALDVSIFNLGFDSVLTALLFSKASKNLITAEKQLFQRSEVFVREPTLANLARIIRELI